MERVDPKALGRRVAARRKTLRLSQAELAALVGMKQQGIDSIERGEVKRPRMLRELAHVLKTTQEWLLYQRGPETAGESLPDVTWVPQISWISAGQLASANADLPVEDMPLLAFVDLGRGEFFALRVQGDSMDRVSPEGSIIVVNRADRELVAGKCYVFAIRGETTYKAWRPGRSGEPPYLEPLTTNTALNKPIFFKGKSPPVVGRVYRSIIDL